MSKLFGTREAVLKIYEDCPSVGKSIGKKFNDLQILKIKGYTVRKPNKKRVKVECLCKCGKRL